MAKKLAVLASAPDFELQDTHENSIKLSALYSQQPVVLVLLRGFA